MKKTLCLIIKAFTRGLDRTSGKKLTQIQPHTLLNFKDKEYILEESRQGNYPVIMQTQKEKGGMSTQF